MEKRRLVGNRCEVLERTNGELHRHILAQQETIVNLQKRLAERDLLVNLFPCPEHGECVPFAIAEAHRWRKFEKMLIEVCHDLGMGVTDNADIVDVWSFLKSRAFIESKKA